MGKNYYYFAASLSMIDFNSKPSVRVEDYLKLCKGFLSENDYACMENLLSGKKENVPVVGNDVVKAWFEFQKSFQNEIVYFRAMKARKNPDDYIREESYRDQSLKEAVSQAVKTENLLEAEKYLDKIRWRFLDAQELGHYFDIEFLCIYGLKLKILDRHKEINSPRGKEIFEIYKETVANTLSAL